MSWKKVIHILQGLLVLNQNRDFKKLYEKGKYYVHPCLVTYVGKNKKKQRRVGITASKKTGNAVKRNRSRRIIRQAFRELYPYVSGDWDVVFVARAKTPQMKSGEIKRVMYGQLKAAGIIK